MVLNSCALILRKNRNLRLLLLLLLREESDDPGVIVEEESAEKPQFATDAEVWRTFREIGITRNPYSEKVARTPGLTRAGILDEWRKLTEAGKPWTGLLLNILELYKAPISEEEKRRRYAEWEQ